MNLYSNIPVPHLMLYFPEALVTDEWNFCLGIPFNYTGLKNESSWVDELSSDRCIEKSAVQIETCFSFHEGRRYIRAYTHTHTHTHTFCYVWVTGKPIYWFPQLPGWLPVLCWLLLAVSRLIHFPQCATQKWKICSIQEYKVANLDCANGKGTI